MILKELIAKKKTDDRKKNEFLKPSKWGEDIFSKYMDNSHANCFASFDNQKEMHRTVCILVNLYNGFATQYLHHPRNKLLQSQLFIKTFFSIKSSLNLAYGGNVADCYSVMRIAIESSLYALAMTKDEESKKIWLDRDNSSEDKKRCKDFFKTGSLLRMLKSMDKVLGEEIEKFYELCIDSGAHPNQGSFMDRLYVEEKIDSDHPYLMQPGLTGDGEEIKDTIECLVYIGYLILRVFQKVFPERFELSGLDKKIY